MLLAACEGFLDKERDHSALVRLQTFFIVQASGAKSKGGGNIQITDLWLLPNERPKTTVQKVWGTMEDFKEWKDKIEIAHGIKLS
jgi:hypothetical protein